MDPKQKRTLRDEEEGIQEYNFPPFSFLLIQQQGTTKLEWWRLLNKNLTDNSTFENLWQKWWPFTNERMYKNGPTGLDEKIVLENEIRATEHLRSSEMILVCQ